MGIYKQHTMYYSTKSVFPKGIENPRPKIGIYIFFIIICVFIAYSRMYVVETCVILIILLGAYVYYIYYICNARILLSVYIVFDKHNDNNRNKSEYLYTFYMYCCFWN